MVLLISTEYTLLREQDLPDLEILRHEKLVPDLWEI